jgi:hypothetical protein
VPVGNDELVVVVVPIAAAAAAAAAAASAIDSVVAVVVDWGAVVVGYGVPVEVAVVEDDGVPDVDERLVEEGVPVGNDVLVLVDVLDGAVVVMGVVIVVVVASTHAMIPIVTYYNKKREYRYCSITMIDVTFRFSLSFAHEM